jgi:hypothetical protein
VKILQDRTDITAALSKKDALSHFDVEEMRGDRCLVVLAEKAAGEPVFAEVRS